MRAEGLSLLAHELRGCKVDLWSINVESRARHSTSAFLVNKSIQIISYPSIRDLLGVDEASTLFTVFALNQPYLSISSLFGLKNHRVVTEPVLVFWQCIVLGELGRVIEQSAVSAKVFRQLLQPSASSRPLPLAIGPEKGMFKRYQGLMTKVVVSADPGIFGTTGAIICLLGR